MERDELKLLHQHFKNYTFMKVLGEGSQGTVFEGIEDQGKITVAIKVLNKNILKVNPILLQLVKNEIKILK